MASKLFSPDEVMALYGVARDDLRHYEDLGLLQPQMIGSVPHYTARDRLRLEIALKGLRLGFSLDEIGALIAGKLVGAATRVRRNGLEGLRLLEELRTLLLQRGVSDASVDDIRSLLLGD